MKHTLRFVCLFLLAIVLQNCSEDENLTKEQVQFSFDLNSSNASGGRVSSSSLPDNSKVLISIQKGDGTPLYTFHEIGILRIGTSLITIPLELTSGSYKITDFMIVNDSDEILYGTPKKGSPLASYITRPLDINFSVRANQLNNIQMEVVDAYRNAPEDFGYVSFNINIVNPLSIAVFRPNGNVLQMTSAKAYILQNNDTLQTFNLGARVNRVGFKQDKTETYTLMIVKDGYTLYKQDFVYDDLMTQLAGQPLKVILSPAFTMLAYADADYANPNFSFRLDGVPGSNVTVDWGDGSSNTYTLGTGEAMEHQYAVTGNYYIAVIGELNKINYFYSFYGQGMIDEINLDQLSELKGFQLGLTRSPKVVSLAKNTKLEALFMPNAVNTTTIDIPATNKISNVELSGPSALTAESLNAIISDVYQSAITDNRMEGYFNFTASWQVPDVGMVVTPSPEAIQKLIQLRDSYNWTIVPEL